MRAVSIALVAGLILAVPAAHAGKPKVFMAVLSGPQETPPNASLGQGNALMTFDETTDMLCYDITYSGLGSAEILAHIHGPAAIGIGPAPVVLPLPGGSPKDGCVGPLTSTQKKELLQNLYYINIHTAGFPGGEIRGQILRIK